MGAVPNRTGFPWKDDMEIYKIYRFPAEAPVRFQTEPTGGGQGAKLTPMCLVTETYPNNIDLFEDMV
ncbi:hypothetical protein C6497_05595 [Candidatus Poribacteria bacterium]|nr:MAG: hypothetical protein C6497_05595 [Candidatus Poribacteria bacterium]